MHRNPHLTSMALAMVVTVASAVVVAVAALVGCAPSNQNRLPRGDWEVAASGVVHGTELRYLTLAGTAYAAPAEPALGRLLGFLEEVGPAWRMPERIDYYAFPDHAAGAWQPGVLRAAGRHQLSSRRLVRHPPAGRRSRRPRPHHRLPLVSR